MQAAQLRQPASERGLLNISFLGAWCWRRGEQSLTAPRRQDAFGTQGGLLCQLEGLSGFIQYPQHTEGWRKGEPGGECHVRPFAFRPASITYVHLCMHKCSPYPQFTNLSLLPVHSDVQGTCTSHPTVLSLCEGCSVKQKLDVSCGLKCGLKISFWVFNSPALFLVFCQSQTNFYFPVAFCAHVSTYRSNRKGDEFPPFSVKVAISYTQTNAG